MKRVIINTLLFLMCAACSYNNPIKEAEKYCDCVKKALRTLARSPAWFKMSECRQEMEKMRTKYKNDPVKLANFDQEIDECRIF